MKTKTQIEIRINQIKKEIEMISNQLGIAGTQDSTEITNLILERTELQNQLKGFPKTEQNNYFENMRNAMLY